MTYITFYFLSKFLINNILLIQFSILYLSYFNYHMATKKPQVNPNFTTGVVVAESKLCNVGEGIGHIYRGYTIQDLAENCIYQEIVHLLIFKKLPTAEQLTNIRKRIASKRQVPVILRQILQKLPINSNPMDVMRSISSILGILQPESETNNQYQIALRLIGVFGPALIYWYHFAKSGLRINTITDPEDTVAENFLKLYLQKNDIDKDIIKTLNVCLIIYAEDGFNPSAYVSRVTVSTMSDIYSGITSGIGALKGVLHGGANEVAMKLLDSFTSVEDANTKVELMWKNKQLFMGFGHRLHKTGDPRSKIIKKYSLLLSQKPYGRKTLLQVSQHIEKRMINEKKIHPNIDYYAVSAYNQCGIHTQFITPVIIISICSGWCANIIQQRESNKIIRPLSNYTGPQNTKFVKIEDRKPLAKL